METRKKVSKHVGAYPVELRLKVVKLFLEEGYSATMLAEEFGCHKSSIASWIRTYRKHGEQGLHATALLKHSATFTNIRKSKIFTSISKLLHRLTFPMLQQPPRNQHHHPHNFLIHQYLHKRQKPRPRFRVNEANFIILLK